MGRLVLIMLPEIINQPVFGITLTLITYYIGLYFRKKWDILLFEPILISMVLIIITLELLNIDFDSYYQGGEYISFLLGPATVALAIPMYRKITLLKKRAKLILISTFCGAVLGILLVIYLGKIVGTGEEFLISMVPKAVTTPIAVGISEEIGGEPSLTVGVVILNGLLGGMFGVKLLNLLNIKSSLARGLTMGMSSHGIGTARALEENDLEGALSGLAIGLMGFFTALTAPFIVNILL